MRTFDGRQLKALIIDDNQNFRQLLRTILHTANIRDCMETGNPLKGLEILQTFQADVCLIDWRLEPMDGITFVRTIRRSPESPNPYLPIIMVTGYTDTRLVLEARDAGINEYLAKPISSKSLLARIAAIAENPRPFIRSPTYFGPDRRRKRMPVVRVERRRAR